MQDFKKENWTVEFLFFEVKGRVEFLLDRRKTKTLKVN